MIPAAKPKFFEASIYKLYVSPVSSYDKTTLTELFSEYAEVADVYMSPPNDAGFKWAFVYFATEQGLVETIRKIEEKNIYNFKLSRAKPKPFLPPGPAAPVLTNIPFAAKMMNGVGQPNGVSYEAPPNCVNCRKLTFQQCGSCRNPFCSKECTLDGWRFHTSSCVKVAELIKINESNGVQGNALTPTVVNFMKDCKYAKKKFTSDEFADACNYRGFHNVSSPAPVENPTVDDYDNVPLPSKQPQSVNDNGKRVPSFRKPSQPISEDEEADPWGLTNNKQSIRTPHKKHTKRNSAAPSKQHRKYSTENEDNDENIKEKTPSTAYPKKHIQNAETVDNAAQNGYRAGDRRVDFKKKIFNESKRSIKSEENRISSHSSTTDLELKPKDSVKVVVGSIMGKKLIYAANPDKMVEVLQTIRDCSNTAPTLKNVEINTLCLASYDGDWYRARVLATNPIEVEYIDYGNRELCEIKNLKKLPESLQKYKPLATKMQLKEGDVQEYEIEENKEIDICVEKFDSVNDVWIVDILY